MISNIQYIMHLYPEVTERILVKHGADTNRDNWIDGCDVVSAYNELLQYFEARYDRDDLDTELDYRIQELLGWHNLEEASDYVATPSALDRESIIEHLLAISEEDSMHECVFSKCEAMIKNYNISANPDWDLSDILDTFTTKQLQELLQYVMDNCKNESLSDDVDELEIPAPYNKYYEIGSSDIDQDALPDAFDHYRELKVVAEVYAKDEYDEALANNGLEFCWLVSDNGRLMLVTSVALRVYPVTLEEVEECVGVTSDYADYDDYEDLDEAVEMTDAQRLALQELDSALECGEVTQEEHDAGQNIQWDINFEDVVLFVSGVADSLKDIKHVAYGDCDESKFDGCYSVTLNNGQVKRYGWHDFDATGALTLIDDCDEGILSAITGMNPGGSLTEDAGGWEKPFDWTERYVKDGFVITGNYEKTSWHLEQTKPKTKHFGNYKTLEAAKAAGDKEISARDNKNVGKEPQFGVHLFSTDSIIFRGTEDECGKYIDDREEIWNDAEVYMMTPSDPHYLQEGTGSDTAHVIRDVLTTASKEDKDGWANTVANIIDIIPDQYMDDLYDITSEKLKDVKVSDSDKKKIIDASGSDVDADNESDTIGKLLALFDVQSWDAATLKKFVLVVLGIVAVIEPTPILEIVTAIVSLLPADVVKTILSITNMIGSPVGAIGTIANRAYQKSKNEDYARVDAKDFVKHPMNYDVTSMLEFEVQDDVKVYIHRGPGRQREFYIIIGDTYVEHSFSKLETVEKYLRRNNLVKEVISESFKPGDVVYVTVCNRQGRVRKMISPDVVEVELHDNGVYPERIDRYYVDEVELQYSDDLDDDF